MSARYALKEDANINSISYFLIIEGAGMSSSRIDVILEDLYKRGKKPARKISVRYLLILSIVTSVAGIYVVYFLAQGASAPLVSISEVYGNYLYNYATVRVKGTVDGIPYFDNSTGKLTIRFSIFDGTMSMNIYIYQPVSLEVLKQRKIPLPGDNVTAEIQLRVRETYTYGILQAAGLLQIETQAAEPVEVTSLDATLAGKYVKASGTITGSRLVSSGLLFWVDTGEGEITVLVPNFMKFMDGAKYAQLVESIRPGVETTVTGLVYLYKGESPEIVVKEFEDITFRAPEKPTEVKIAALPGYAGKTVVVKAYLEVQEYLSDSRSYVLKLIDETGEASGIVKREIMMTLNPFNLINNNKVIILASVQEDGELNIKNIEAPEIGKVSFVKVADISESIKGKIVAAKGKVTNLVERSSYTLFYLEDETGRIKIFIPASVYNEITSVKISEGTEISVAGYVDIYRSELEIVVFSPLGVKG